MGNAKWIHGEICNEGYWEIEFAVRIDGKKRDVFITAQSLISLTTNVRAGRIIVDAWSKLSSAARDDYDQVLFDIFQVAGFGAETCELFAKSCPESEDAWRQVASCFDQALPHLAEVLHLFRPDLEPATFLAAIAEFRKPGSVIAARSTAAEDASNRAFETGFSSMFASGSLRQKLMPKMYPNHVPVREDVYFVRCRADGDRIKIGMSHNVLRRVASLGYVGGLHLPMEILGVIPQGGHKEEARLHSKFRHLWQSGEWFATDESILAYVTENGKTVEEANAIREKVKVVADREIKVVSEATDREMVLYAIDRQPEWSDKQIATSVMAPPHLVTAIRAELKNRSA